VPCWPRRPPRRLGFKCTCRYVKKKLRFRTCCQASQSVSSGGRSSHLICNHTHIIARSPGSSSQKCLSRGAVWLHSPSARCTDGSADKGQAQVTNPIERVKKPWLLAIDLSTSPAGPSSRGRDEPTAAATIGHITAFPRRGSLSSDHMAPDRIKSTQTVPHNINRPARTLLQTAIDHWGLPRGGGHSAHPRLDEVSATWTPPSYEGAPLPAEPATPVRRR
jgi:hypothetical protein